MKTVVFTIASKNYFAYVRTLMKSLEDSNPHMDRYVVVVDELDDEFIALPRNFDLLELSRLDLPHPKCFQFRYDIMEFNTAVKPFAIRKLFEQYDRVIYLDPDIYVYQRLLPVENALDSGNNFVFTPHFNGLFENDGMHPSEVDIMLAGIYNLGFIALNKCADTLEMVSWWADKLEYQCVNEQEKGIFVDQKWMDLVPAYYTNVCILHDSGLNVAYWNLSHRKVVKKQGEWYVNDDPLIFFHFSGLNVHDINAISKHQNRYVLADIGDASELFENYSKIVLSNEFDMWKKFKYSYNKYSDGRAVLKEHRKKYRRSKALQSYCKENPYEYGWLFYGNKKIELPSDGVNLIGYLSSEHGVGEAARLTANCLDAVKIDWCGYDFEIGNPSQKNDKTFKDRIENFIKYGVSIINVNADQMPVLRRNTPKELWDTYRIGVWYWELPEFPVKWMSAFFDVDEIWAPTKYIADCLQKCATCPVYHMPPGIIRKEVEETIYNRAYYDLPENAFLFLNMFDVYSISGRKNPEAAVKAFQSAFSPDDMSVGLVLKLNNSRHDDKEHEMLNRLIKSYKNIYIIAKTMTREAVNGLLNTCDAAVSLHRSEGLGLLCEEAMFYGKPVIATAWSGNMDFMTEDTACLVDFDMVSVGEDIGPYEAWQKWADPSVEQAAEYMKKLVSDKSYYEAVSVAAKAFIRNDFTPSVCGARMKKRLDEIVNMIERGEYTWSTAKNTEVMAKLCIPCYQKLTGKELSGKEQEQLAAAWSKGLTVNFHKVAVDMSKSDIVRKGSDREFIIKVYESILERTPSEDEIASWANRLIITRRTRVKALAIKNRIWIMEAILKSGEFMGDYADAYRNGGVKGLIKNGGRKFLKIYRRIKN
ncbi:MAG: glycosyltransferase [Lachnospiraceae bacterium]|nr:glycosyltransferase [Lachnospiraceae bacterium]